MPTIEKQIQNEIERVRRYVTGQLGGSRRARRFVEMLGTPESIIDAMQKAIERLEDQAEYCRYRSCPSSWPNVPEENLDRHFTQARRLENLADEYRKIKRKLHRGWVEIEGEETPIIALTYARYDELSGEGQADYDDQVLAATDEALVAAVDEADALLD